jgi:starch synthase
VRLIFPSAAAATNPSNHQIINQRQESTVLKVLFATSEAVPFAKTGGLADVSGALPSQLRQLGHDVVVFMPAYRCVFESGLPIRKLDIHFDVPVGNRAIHGSICVSEMPNSDVPIYFIHQEEYFDRDHLYGEGGVDYRDNCERFVFFNRAVLEAIRLLDLDIDIIHCNDWQTGLIPCYLEAEYRAVARYEKIATLTSIHNMAYQGQFWHWDMLLTGLDWKYFNWKQLEFHGDLNLLKAAIVFSDSINTVSPTYAAEIQSAPLGCGLEGALSQKRDVLSGILNGVDYDQWHPQNDQHIAETFDEKTWKTGKAACKQALQKSLGLSEEPKTPVIGIVSRLVEQKGIDMILYIMERWARYENAQWVVLGTGTPEYEKQLRQLADNFPTKVAAKLEFSNALAHQIEAGSDLFMMPSRYEPCGLNQIYSLAYGTLPIVHKTGGLADTVFNLTEQSAKSKTSNGFVFEPFNVEACEKCLRTALDVYLNQTELWQQLVETAMAQDHSWRASAQQYSQLYRDTMARRAAERKQIVRA